MQQRFTPMWREPLCIPVNYSKSSKVFDYYRCIMFCFTLDVMSITRIDGANLGNNFHNAEWSCGKLVLQFILQINDGAGASHFLTTLENAWEEFEIAPHIETWLKPVLF